MLDVIVRMRFDEVRVAARDDVPLPRVCTEIVVMRQQRR
jgi:hypothetical protein